MNLANVILKVYFDLNAVSAVTLNPLCKIECPMVSMNSQNLLGMKDHPNVKRWKDCSRICASDPNCNVWSWNHGGATVYPYYCRTSFASGHFGEDINVVSGYKNCTGLDILPIPNVTALNITYC